VNKHTIYRIGTYALAAFLLIWALIACGPVSGPAANPALQQASPTSSSSTPAPASAPTGSFRDLIREVTDRVKPAVVQVTNEQVVSGQFQQGTAIPVGVGSGIIYDTEGHILTNNHVVEGASQLIVSLPDGRSLPAKLIGRDPQTDLAVIQISGSNLPVAELGDSTQMHVGDWVVAIGNALALPGGPTVTAGLVSATGRVVQEPSSSSSSSSQGGAFLFDMIQTDAPINPGNSGGPLINLDAQVIGINTLGGGQTSQGATIQDINFAISMATAKPIADQLVQTGTVIHPYLGISYGFLTPAIAAQYGYPVSYGDVVTAIASGSPAEKAGLQPQDIILEMDGQKIDQESTLAVIIHQHKPGDTLALTVMRGSQQTTVQVTLGEQS
jgi:S1-C subfamily serine protease